MAKKKTEKGLKMLDQKEERIRGRFKLDETVEEKANVVAFLFIMLIG